MHGFSAHERHLQELSVQTEALCIGKFSWAMNSFGQSPCLVAAYLLAPCVAGDWLVPKLNSSGFHYTPPSTSNVNRCQCSWAVYNLLQACAVCQGEDNNGAIFGWNGWSTNCTSNFLSKNEPYPLDIPIPDATGIRYYATLNPSTWENAIFDPIAAQALASQNHPDLTEETRSSHSSGSKGTNVAALAGGLAGGIILLIIGASFCVHFFVSRRKYRSAGLTNTESTLSTNWTRRPRLRGTLGHRKKDSHSSEVALYPSPISPMSGMSGVGTLSLLAVDGSHMNIQTITELSPTSAVGPDSLRLRLPNTGVPNAQSYYLDNVNQSPVSPRSIGGSYPDESWIITPFEFPDSHIISQPQRLGGVVDVRSPISASLLPENVGNSSLGANTAGPARKERRNPPAYSEGLPRMSLETSRNSSDIAWASSSSATVSPDYGSREDAIPEAVCNFLARTSTTGSVTMVGSSDLRPS